MTVPAGRALAALLVVAVTVFPAASSEVPRVLPWTGPTPPLELEGLDGGTHRLEDYRGRAVLVNFWATWCEPCRDEMPSMQRLRERVGEERFTILAVNYGESPARIEPFLRSVGVDFAVLLDRDRRAARAWRVRILPASFLVGPDGQVRHHVIGEIDWTGDEAASAVQKLLGITAPGAGSR